VVFPVQFLNFFYRRPEAVGKPGGLITNTSGLFYFVNRNEMKANQNFAFGNTLIKYNYFILAEIKEI
jgi:hypothetical protein